ncbi:MAG TPA: glycosyltransferase family 4 protein [Gemmatimonadaceae bacterium]|nr:glycosyltransferase family 4 protein [Gemmatimonadaceae bacterium]
MSLPGNFLPGGPTAAPVATRDLAVARASRILLVAPQPFYQARGTPIAVLQVLTALSGLGYDVDVLTYPVGAEVSLPGVTVARCANPLGLRRVPIGLSWRKLVLDAAMLVPLARAMASGRYACVHAVEEMAFPAVLLGRQLGVPVIYDMQSSLAQQLAARPGFGGAAIRRLLDAAERWLVRSATIVAASTGLAERVRAMAPGARVVEWRFTGLGLPTHPSDLGALRDSLGLSPSARVVLYCGSFEPYQGLGALVEAIPGVRARVGETVFVLVGSDGGAGESLGRAARALVDAGALRVIERRPREEIPRFLALADVLVSPRSYGDNLPLKIFDYLETGRPIVATDIPSHRALLGDERALLCAPEPRAIADAVTAVLTDRARAEALGAAARHFAERQLGWRRFVQSLGELYGATIVPEGTRAA